LKKEIKLVIDSVIEDLVRVRLSSEHNRTTLNVKVEALKAILRTESIKEGRSYVLTLTNIEDFKNLWSGTFDSSYKFQGDNDIKDTTKEDLAEIRRRLRKLRRSR
jgi:hypothetical protein